jgi:hypothetical protein
MILDRLKDPSREVRKVIAPLKVMNRVLAGTLDPV